MMSIIKLIFTKQFIVFLLVGILNTCVGFGIYAVFIGLGCHYTLAALLATCLGCIFNYFSTGKIVFSTRKGRVDYFGLVYVLNYLLNIGLIKFYTLFGFDQYSAYLLSLPATVLVSFVLMRYFVFIRGMSSISNSALN